ncbi:MAG: TetR/AcrR family transcriptional regulator [Pseudomonadota bacterium]
MPTPAKKRPRGRPRGFDEETALRAAMLTFWKNGYQRTSLDQIVEATGASRAGLYATFGDKEAIFSRCLKLYGDELEARVDEALRHEDPIGGLRELLLKSADRLSDPMTPPGCLRCNATLELSETGLFDRVRDANDRYKHHMARIVDRAVQLGRLPEAEAAGLASFITAVVNGMVILSRTGAGRDELHAIVDRTLRQFGGT